MDSRAPYPRYYREPPRPAAPRYASEWRDGQAPVVYPQYDKNRLDRTRYEERRYDRQYDGRGYEDRRYEAVAEPRRYDSRYEASHVPPVREEYYQTRAGIAHTPIRYEREVSYPKYNREPERETERVLHRQSYVHHDERRYEAPRSRSKSPLQAHDTKKNQVDRERVDDRYVEERERRVETYSEHADRGRRDSLERSKVQRGDSTRHSMPSNNPSTPNETSHIAPSNVNRARTASGPSSGPRGPAKSRPPPRPQDDGVIRPRVGRLFPSIRPEAFKDIARYRTEAMKLEEADKKVQKIKRQTMYEWECAQREVALADLRVDLAERNLEAITNNLAFS